MRYLLSSIVLFIFIGCSDNSSSTTQEEVQEEVQSSSYPLHKNIIVTIFWVGEESSQENGYIHNLASAWDGNWILSFGGTDTPESRDGYYPSAFTPKENPFYFALPYSDMDDNGKKKNDINSYIPWATLMDNKTQSICKNRWIKITKNEKTVYAQWEDVGPFGENDKSYVFGSASPNNDINANAGLDVSPAVRDYLNLDDIDLVSWRFVDDGEVPDGPWRKSVTISNIGWQEWYKPNKSSSWQWQLKDNVNASYDVEVYDIDLFDSTTELIQELQNSGKKVICYFSGGSFEKWREDNTSFSEAIKGKTIDGWEDEKWLDISSAEVFEIMIKRLDKAKAKGCDGVEPDNMDNYVNDTGFDLSASDQLRYNKFIANEAHLRGLSVGLKNDTGQIRELEPYFDFSINEECHKYDECDSLIPFIDANKPVFNAEYIDINKHEKIEEVCSDARNLEFKTLILPLDLDDSFRYSCN